MPVTDSHRGHRGQAQRFANRFVEELRRPVAVDALTEMLIRNDERSSRVEAESAMAMGVLRWLKRRMAFASQIPSLEIEDRMIEAGIPPEELQ